MSEKTEQPTHKKLEDARKKGDVAVSKELSSVLTYVTAIALMGGTAATVGATFRSLYHDVIQAIAADQAIPVALGTTTTVRVGDAILAASVPFLGALALIGVAAGFGQTGWVLSFEPLKPNLDKLNPLKKLKQWFGMKGLFEFAKTLVKLLVVLFVGYLAIKGSLAMILRLGLTSTPQILALTTATVRQFLLTVGLVFAAIAAADLFFQRWQWRKNLMMSKDEVKREYKESEGDPEIKGHRRQLQHEMMSGDVQEAVAHADAVTVNPTHLAVAIRYRKGEMRAPKVVAKGQRAMAEKIIAWAKKSGVPIVRDITLTRALYELAVEDNVPRDLYAAVAEVLTFAAKMREEAEEGLGGRPGAR